MKIQARDIFTGEDIILTTDLTTEHPLSRYGQAVMVIEEWDGQCMSHQNWILASCKVIEAIEKEQSQFFKWHQLLEVMK